MLRDASRPFSASRRRQHRPVSYEAVENQRTRGVELLKQLVVLSSQLGPFRKLVLAARCVELVPHAEVLRLELALLGRGLGRRHGEVVDQCPELYISVSVLVCGPIPRG